MQVWDMWTTKYLFTYSKRNQDLYKQVLFYVKNDTFIALKKENERTMPKNRKLDQL